MSYQLFRFSFANFSVRLGASLCAALMAVTAGTAPLMAQELNIQPKLPDLSHILPPSTDLKPLPFSTMSEPEKEYPELVLKAKLTDESPDITNGLIWRVFSPDAGDDGQLPLIATAKGGTVTFTLPKASYLVHVAYGRAGATKRITMQNEARHETMVLEAGGLKLNAVLPEGKKPIADLLRFSIYGDDDTSNDRSLILPDVKPDVITRLNAGTYHVVSNYGAANAVIRADIRVEAGKLTEATVEHRAANITLKLVREKGGEALADTSWSVLNASGDGVRESVGAYASMVLSEGEYIAIAKNKDRIYQRDFKVVSGQNDEVDVIASAEFEANNGTIDNE
ncbi:hypothetical protein ACI0FM_13130 [Paenochrobactrum sp. BZR 588]|uniref:hypothetical protein n=1 Tax=Paenochrobactrum TaxID=999488 RepID=UPI0035BC3630